MKMQDIVPRNNRLSLAADIERALWLKFNTGGDLSAERSPQALDDDDYDDFIHQVHNVVNFAVKTNISNAVEAVDKYVKML